MVGCDVPTSGNARCSSNGYECGDCIDNDYDGKTDYNVNAKGKVLGDPDCTSLTDNSESPPCTDTCATRGYNCGTWSICGTNTNCGSCNTGYYCNSIGQCVLSCTPESNTAFCTRLGKECGSVTANDNCGTPRTVNCGTCDTGESCSNGVCVASCTPESNTAFCTRLGKAQMVFVLEQEESRQIISHGGSLMEMQMMKVVTTMMEPFTEIHSL